MILYMKYNVANAWRTTHVSAHFPEHDDVVFKDVNLAKYSVCIRYIYVVLNVLSDGGFVMRLNIV
jgi:hypothetical protein